MSQRELKPCVTTDQRVTKEDDNPEHSSNTDGGIEKIEDKPRQGQGSLLDKKETASKSLQAHEAKARMSPAHAFTSSAALSTSAPWKKAYLTKTKNKATTSEALKAHEASTAESEGIPNRKLELPPAPAEPDVQHDTARKSILRTRRKGRRGQFESEKTAEGQSEANRSPSEESRKVNVKPEDTTADPPSPSPDDSKEEAVLAKPVTKAMGSARTTGDGSESMLEKEPKEGADMRSHGDSGEHKGKIWPASLGKWLSPVTSPASDKSLPFSDKTGKEEVAKELKTASSVTELAEEQGMLSVLTEKGSLEDNLVQSSISTRSPPAEPASPEVPGDGESTDTRNSTGDDATESAGVISDKRETARKLSREIAPTVQSPVSSSVHPPMSPEESTEASDEATAGSGTQKADDSSDDGVDQKADDQGVEKGSVLRRRKINITLRKNSLSRSRLSPTTENGWSIHETGKESSIRPSVDKKPTKPTVDESISLAVRSLIASKDRHAKLLKGVPITHEKVGSEDQHSNRSTIGEVSSIETKSKAVPGRSQRSTVSLLFGGAVLLLFIAYLWLQPNSVQSSDGFFRSFIQQNAIRPSDSSVYREAIVKLTYGHPHNPNLPYTLSLHEHFLGNALKVEHIMDAGIWFINRGADIHEHGGDLITIEYWIENARHLGPDVQGRMIGDMKIIREKYDQLHSAFRHINLKINSLQQSTRISHRVNIKEFAKAITQFEDEQSLCRSTPETCPSQSPQLRVLKKVALTSTEDDIRATKYSAESLLTTCAEAMKLIDDISDQFREMLDRHLVVHNAVRKENMVGAGNEQLTDRFLTDLQIDEPHNKRRRRQYERAAKLCMHFGDLLHKSKHGLEKVRVGQLTQLHQHSTDVERWLKKEGGAVVRDLESVKDAQMLMEVMQGSLNKLDSRAAGWEHQRQNPEWTSGILREYGRV